jgi:hypothetical protein
LPRRASALASIRSIRSKTSILLSNVFAVSLIDRQSRLSQNRLDLLARGLVSGRPLLTIKIEMTDISQNAIHAGTHGRPQDPGLELTSRKGCSR